MARELFQSCWTVLTVLVLSHHYFRVNIKGWEITTVITVKKQAFDVETLEVRSNDEGSVYITIKCICLFSLPN